MRVPVKRFVLSLLCLRIRLTPSWHVKLCCITLGTFAFVAKCLETDGCKKSYPTCACCATPVDGPVGRKSRAMPFFGRVFALLLGCIDLLVKDDFTYVMGEWKGFRVPVSGCNSLAARAEPWLSTLECAIELLPSESGLCLAKSLLVGVARDAIWTSCLDGRGVGSAAACEAWISNQAAAIAVLQRARFQASWLCCSAPEPARGLCRRELL